MKLRNLMYATMIACAFASCSKDEDGVDVPVVGAGDAELVVQVKTPALTKADVPADQKITNLSVLVFDEKGTLEAKATDVAGSTNDPKTSVKASKITAGAKKVLVLANVKTKVDTYTTTTTLTNVLADNQDFSVSEVDGTLSMNSGLYSVDLKAGATNYLGYIAGQESTTAHYLTEAVGGTTDPVKLYRNVAKINLSKVTLTASTEKYKNAKLTISDVFILHANKNTMLVGKDGAAWGATVPAAYNFLNGASNTDYAKWVTYMSGKLAVQKYLNGSNYAEATGLPYSFNDLNQVLEIGNVTEWTPTDKSFYAYENASADYTLLVVKAKLEYGTITGGVAEYRYYSVAIGKDGIAGITSQGIYSKPTGFDGERADLFGTVRNLQYNVDLKIAGPGYTTPFGPKAEDDTFLDVKVDVVAFGQVNQDHEIE